ncbi:hypothetical protein HMI56_001088 [Coelomomyces lativittatus]|nr:hypothetical protein HMI56_001088 [Coelomomyces lativittatus]
MREKTDSLDYRFMPEVNLPTLFISDSDVKEIRKTLPELPNDKRHRILKNFNSVENVRRLVDSGASDYFDKMCLEFSKVPPAHHFHWLTSELLGKTDKLTKVTPKQLGGLSELVHMKSISSKIAKNILSVMLQGDPRTALEIAEENRWAMIRDENVLKTVIQKVLNASYDPKRATNPNYISWMVGKVLQETSNRGDPVLTQSLVADALKQRTAATFSEAKKKK